MIDVVLLTYNRLAYLKKTLRALLERTSLPLQIIIVDNASSDLKVKKYLQEQLKKKVLSKVIFLKKNLFLQGWYYGIKEVNSPLFVLSDPDIIVPKLSPCWLSQLLSYMENYQEIVRLALSLSPDNIPPCWNKKYKKMLSFKSGPLFKKNKNLRLGEVISTTQLIRKNAFDRLNFKKKQEINLKFWQNLRKYGLSAVIQSIEAIHLGWNEYEDYPEYLLEKNGKLGNYKEIELIKNSGARLAVRKKIITVALTENR